MLKILLLQIQFKLKNKYFSKIVNILHANDFPLYLKILKYYQIIWFSDYLKYRNQHYETQKSDFRT